MGRIDDKIKCTEILSSEKLCINPKSMTMDFKALKNDAETIFIGLKKK